ncbi:MAG: hypothetical protein ABFS12_16715 [Bacteroidota bacterium]
MKSFKEFIDSFNQAVDLQGLKKVISLISVESIDIDKMPMFINKLKNEFAQSLTVMNDSRGYTLKFYKLTDTLGFLRFLSEEMVYKGSIDQTSRDNIFLTLFEPIKHKGIFKIELISREEINPKSIEMEEIEVIRININIE